MAEGTARLAVKNRGRLLIEDGRALLLHDTGLLALCASALQLRHVQPLGSSGLVTGKVIARQEYRHKNWMGGIHSSVDHCDDAGATNAKALLRVRQADDLRGRLRCVAMGSQAAVIVDQSGVRKPGWRAADLAQRSEFRAALPADSRRRRQSLAANWPWK